MHTASRACFTRCFTLVRSRHGHRHRVRRRSRHGHRHRIRRSPRTHTTYRSQVVPGRRQGRHIAHGQLDDARDGRGRAVRVAQACAPRGPVGASPEHRHRRRPHRHKNSARPHGHRQVAARVSGVPLRDASQVEAGARHSVTMSSAIRRGHASALGGGACGLVLTRGVIGLSVAANEAAGIGRKATGIDRQATGIDRKAAGIDRQAAGVDRQAAGVGRKAADIGRQAAGPTAACGAGGCPQRPAPLADARQQVPRRGT